MIGTASHFASDIVVAWAHEAADLGAAMIMLMPPYHGATLKGTAEQSFEQFRRAGAAEKLRQLIVDGEESITLMADLDAGATAPCVRP